MTGSFYRHISHLNVMTGRHPIGMVLFGNTNILTYADEIPIWDFTAHITPSLFHLCLQKPCRCLHSFHFSFNKTFKWFSFVDVSSLCHQAKTKQHAKPTIIHTPLIVGVFVLGIGANLCSWRVMFIAKAFLFPAGRIRTICH